MPRTLKIPVSCNKDCGGGCPLTAHVKGGKIIKIRNNPAAPETMTGCVRGYKAHEVVYAADRITHPLIRTGERGSGQFREAGWEEALDLMAEQLLTVKTRFGNESILLLGGSGACRGAFHNTELLPDRFLKLYGGYTRLSGSYSTRAVSFVRPYLFGYEPSGLDAPTLLETKLVILWGANISVTRFGTELENSIKTVRRKGTPVVVIDPRRTKTVNRLGTWWVPIYPGTDSVLMCALLWILLSERMVDRKQVDRISHGFDRLEAYIIGEADGIPKTPQWASPRCGVPEADIRTLAELYGKTKPAALIPGLSIQRTIGGEETMRLATALQVATGNVGTKGGSSGGNVWNSLPEPYCPSIELDTPTHPGPTVAVYRWPDAVLRGREGGYPSQIRFLYNVGGNYLNQGSDIKKNSKAFSAVDFSVTHDLFLTPTAAYCDVVLPVTSWLEREDIISPGINYLFYSKKAVEPPPGVLNDWDIFCKLAARLGILEEFSGNQTPQEWLSQFIDESEIEDEQTFRSSGIYKGPNQERVGLSEFVQDPEAFPLSTPSGKIEIASSDYERTGFPAHPVPRIYQIHDAFPLRCITPHAEYRINSSNWNVPWFRGKEKQVVWMHLRDAKKRNISQGGEIIVTSERGSLVVRAAITEKIMPGVVSIDQGAWVELGPDMIDRSGSANILTDTEPTLPSEGSRTHSIRVEIRRYHEGPS